MRCSVCSYLTESTTHSIYFLCLSAHNGSSKVLQVSAEIITLHTKPLLVSYM